MRSDWRNLDGAQLLDGRLSTAGSVTIGRRYKLSGSAGESYIVGTLGRGSRYENPKRLCGIRLRNLSIVLGIVF